MVMMIGSWTWENLSSIMKCSETTWSRFFIQGMFVTLQVWEGTEMGIINKYYTTHKYICIHVCEGTGLCECWCACLFFVHLWVPIYTLCFLNEIQIFLYELLDTLHWFWFLYSVMQMNPLHFIKQRAVIKRMPEMTILLFPSCIFIFAEFGIASWDY